MYICILFSISFQKLFFKVSIRELIGVITSNYRLVDSYPIILFRSQVFHDTFWNDKVSLSSSNQSIFYVFNCLHFTSFWWFFDMRTVEDRKILMRDTCIICVGPDNFFSATLYGDFILVFWFCVFDHSLWLFSSHGSIPF